MKNATETKKNQNGSPVVASRKNATMKNITESSLIALGTPFINTLAAQYQLPELRGIGFTNSKQLPDGVVLKTDEISVEPTGQLSCIVKAMTVRVEISSTTDGKHVRGSIHYSYSHHSGGSNCSNQDFVIVTESYLGERVYTGTISERLACAYQNQISQAA